LFSAGENDMTQIGPTGYVQLLYPIYSPEKTSASPAINGMMPLPSQPVIPNIQPAISNPQMVTPNIQPILVNNTQPTVTNVQPGVYGGIQNHGMQNYLPISEKRPLLPEEEMQIQKGLKQWWPKIGAGYATPMPRLLADPAKSATLTALGLGLFGAAMSLYVRTRAHFALAGFVLGAVIGAISGYINRRQQNENIIDLIQRFQPGATKRDMLSDPVIQSELNRKATAQSGGGDLFTAMLLSSALSGNYSSRKR
jgi:hypothetical protein